MFDHTKNTLTDALGLFGSDADNIKTISEELFKNYSNSKMSLNEIMEEARSRTVSILLEVPLDETRKLPLKNLHVMLFGYGLMSGDIVYQINNR